MANELTNLGEEYDTKNDWRGTNVELGMYNDASDSITDTDDIDAINTEPTDGNYQRQTATIQDADVQKINGDWGWELSVSFDVTDTTGDVDAGFAVVEFQAEETGDSTVNKHLVLCMFGDDGTMSLSNHDQIDGTFRFTKD
jgi:hypothetical protein